MSLDHIVEILSTVREYNNVRITQTFSTDGRDVFSVRCIADTNVLELTYLEESKVEHFDTVMEAAVVIDAHLNKNHVT